MTKQRIYTVIGSDYGSPEHWVERIFTSKELADEYAADCNQRSSYYSYFVRERSLYSSLEDAPRIPDDFEDDYDDEPYGPDNLMDDGEALASAGWGMDEDY